MTVLTTIPNGASMRDIRDTINRLLADVAGLKTGGGTGVSTPTVTISAALSKPEGNGGATLYVYTVTRSSTAGAVAVPWAFAAGQTSADDFTGGAYPAGGTVAMAAGVASGTITISVNGDTEPEANEDFTVSISAPAGYAAGSAMSATGTIMNDDAAGPFVARNAPALASPGIVVTASNASTYFQQTALAGFDMTPVPAGYRTITVNSDATQQAYFGVGNALTEGACYELMVEMSDDRRAAILQEMFGDNAFNIVRVTIGDCDYCVNARRPIVGSGVYKSYNDVAGDTAMLNFSIAKDMTYVVPVLKQVLAINPDIKIIACSWSPPAWMKTTGDMTTGAIRNEPAILTAFARYLTRYVQAMQAQGVPIYSVSPQNEPGYENATASNDPLRPYPSCIWTPTMLADFVGNYMGPQFADAGLSAKIWTADDSVSATGLTGDVLRNSKAGPYIDAATVHGYNDFLGDMPKTVGDKPWHMTEIISATDDQELSASYFMSGTFMPTFRNGGSSVVLWNAFLDPNGQPGLDTARPVVTVGAGGGVTRRVEYYLLAHFAKYVRPGALRIGSTSFAVGSGWRAPGNDVETVAFKNPDGTIALIIWNPKTTAQSFYVHDVIAGVGKAVTIAAKSIATVQFRNPAIASNETVPEHYVLLGKDDGGIYAPATAANEAASLDIITWTQAANRSTPAPGTNIYLANRWRDEINAEKQCWRLQVGSDGFYGFLWKNPAGQFFSSYAKPLDAYGSLIQQSAKRGLWDRVIANPTATARTTVDGINVPQNSVTFLYAFDDGTGQPKAWQQYSQVSAGSTDGLRLLGTGAEDFFMGLVDKAGGNFLGRVFKGVVRDLATGRVLFNPDFTAAGVKARENGLTDTAATPNTYNIYGQVI